jgi:hypothetical protein
MLIFNYDIEAAKLEVWREIRDKPINQRGAWLDWHDFKNNVLVEEV